MPAASNTEKKPAAVDGDYVVTAVGVAYVYEKVPLLGLHNDVIKLDDDEAMRLLLLGAIRPAEDGEVEAAKVRAAQKAEEDALYAQGPADNPYGGSIVGGGTLEEHAAKQIAEANKAAAKRAG